MIAERTECPTWYIRAGVEPPLKRVKSSLSGAVANTHPASATDADDASGAGIPSLPPDHVDSQPRDPGAQPSDTAGTSAAPSVGASNDAQCASLPAPAAAAACAGDYGYG